MAVTTNDIALCNLCQDQRPGACTSSYGSTNLELLFNTGPMIKL